MDLLWFVAHTRPRCEKKLADFCQREGISTTLPLFKSVKKYRGKTVTFLKPLFPNYLFLQLEGIQRQTVRQNQHTANLLEVFDQQTLQDQLENILAALDTDLEICLAPEIKVGTHVRVKSGPLRGMEGFVQTRAGQVKIILRLDFIGQGAAITVHASDLELA